MTAKYFLLAEPLVHYDISQHPLSDSLQWPFYVVFTMKEWPSLILIKDGWTLWGVQI